MQSDADQHHRRSIRLPGYDYASPGAYFVTFTTWQRLCIFGAVNAGYMELSQSGEIVTEEWRRSADLRQEVELDEFVVMPNHLHAIVFLRDVVGAHGRAPQRRLDSRNGLFRPPRSLSSLVAGFKSAATRRINEARMAPRVPVWQRNYYERIIRNDDELNRIRQYILDNPTKWDEDPENPSMRRGEQRPVI